MKKILLSTALLTALFATESKAEVAVKEGQWTITPRAGIAPESTKDARITRTFTYTTPGQSVALPSGNGDLTNTTPDANGNSFTRRSYNAKTHNMPYTFGIDLGYVPMDNLEVFFAFDYTKANGKKHTATRADINTTNGITATKTQLVSKYKQSDFESYGFHLGGRYFFDLESKFSPFIGGKLGLVRHTHGKHKVKDTITRYNTNLLTGITSRFASVNTNAYKLPLYKNSTGFSGGLQIGFDLRVSEQVSFVSMVEAIASTGIRTDKKAKLVYREPGAGNNYTVFSKVTRSPKSSFSFPITAGVKVRM